MAQSISQNTGEEEPVVNKGHDVGSLGPSDSSDSGSDIVGGPGLGKDDDIGLDRGPNNDPDRGGGAGPDVGDADLDSDSDSGGTGERGTAGRDAPLKEGWDIGTDQILQSEDLPAQPDEEDKGDEVTETRRRP